MLAIQERPTPLHMLSTRDVIAAATASHEVFSEPLVQAPYELFRRALLDRDEPAWDCLYQSYENLLASWIAARLNVSLDTYPALISEIWTKLLVNIRTPEKFASFANLGAILAYLKCCTFSACVDYVRRLHRDDRMFSLEGLQEDEHAVFWQEDHMEDHANYEHLLCMLSTLLHSDKERLIVQHMLIDGDKPGTLLKMYPHVFDSVESIYWCRHKLVERLRRSKMLRSAKEALWEK